MLARESISREVRGHLQSHGLTGVQARHYDGHDYIPEKRRALEDFPALIGSEAPAGGTGLTQLQLSTPVLRSGA